ncbi:SURF5-domain-containing protein [Piromyces finnis]|uniref:SURF5-domain-containing protein n=1 Tax=Piromyces finnis TaxID=1754191 RepID=A0A1Y1VB94_9FUNG|nr:SURF5-domain-containing protein [Piromyces finnis]|eukprot:ORX51763.1 SURF5-domain-containing protein [Piromyces finnis]
MSFTNLDKKNKFVQNEEEYNKRLDTEIDQLIDSFHHIVKASKIGDSDKYKIFQEEYLINCMSSNIIRSAQSLLTLISELKQSILIFDYKSLNSGILSRIETIEQEKINVSDMLMSLQSDIRNNIKELEDVHYSSISFEIEDDDKSENIINDAEDNKNEEDKEIRNKS